MELTERLRQRSQQAKQTAQVDCGGLGVLTVQALPLRECEALSAGPDGDRALLYAACRQLQTAGEQLRREGRLFRPDEIMQLVSDEEAKTGAAAVRLLSGPETPPASEGEAPAFEEQPAPAPPASGAPGAAEAPPALTEAPAYETWPARAEIVREVQSGPEGEPVSYGDARTPEDGTPGGGAEDRGRSEAPAERAAQGTQPTEKTAFARKEAPPAASPEAPAAGAQAPRRTPGPRRAPDASGQPGRAGTEPPAQNPSPYQAEGQARTGSPQKEAARTGGGSPGPGREAAPRGTGAVPRGREAPQEPLPEAPLEGGPEGRDTRREGGTDSRTARAAREEQTQPLPQAGEDFAREVARLIAQGLRRAAGAR